MGIATPEVYAEMLNRAKEGKFAYPAINVTSSQTLNAALRPTASSRFPSAVPNTLPAPPSRTVSPAPSP